MLYPALFSQLGLSTLRRITPQDAIFGVLYTLSKERQPMSFRTSFLKLFVDFAQLIVFYVDPAFGWSFSQKTSYDVFYYFQLQNSVTDIGYTVRVAAAYPKHV